VNPESRKNQDLIAREWKGAQGLAEDVRYYGKVDARRGREADRPPLPEDEVTAEMAKGRPT
jgi:hypothetical protein